MTKTIEELEAENIKLREGLQQALDMINKIHYECQESLTKLNEKAHNNPKFRNMNGMYDVDLSYMMEIGRFAWADRAKQIVGYYVRPILTKALETNN